MPKTKKISRKTKKSTYTEDVPEYSAPVEPPVIEPTKKSFDTRVIFVVVLLLGLIALLYTNKSLFLAAMVDGKPIFRWNLNKVLTARYGQQTLEGIISEAIITGEAARSNISITQEEIDARQKEVLKGLGEDVNLEELLKFQGMTKADFDSQIRLQLTVQKLLGKDLQITETDIDNFIATNRARLVATDPAQLRVEAKEAILDMLIGEKVGPWFNALKEKANVLRYL